MKFIYTLCLLVFAISANTQTIYVKPNGNGAGTSWADAQSNLKTALDQATDGTQIWVAAGTYIPHTSDRTISFVLKTGVSILGGFPATGDPTLDDRNPDENPSVLNGDIGLLNDTNDNAYTVLTVINPGMNTEIDGLVIANGNASESEENEDINTYVGGGIYLSGEDGEMHAPVIKNCMFSNNIAFSGGAIYSRGTLSSTISPVFEDCMFTSNTAEFAGAIQNEANQNGNNNPSFNNCTFQGNQSVETGGAMYNIGNEGSLVLNISKCAFYNNSSSVGGAIFNFPNVGTLTAGIDNCIFYQNEAESGGAIDNFGFDQDEVNVNISYCTFTENTAEIGGVFSTFGGAVNINSINSIFWNNTATGEGITASNFAGGTTVFDYCLVDENSCNQGGFVGECSHMIFGQDPLFINPDNLNFLLAPCSPVLDMGTAEHITSMTDLAGNNREFGDSPDLGALEWNGSPAVLTINTITPVDISCNGETDGSILLEITGGVEPYNIATNLENLSAGTYTVEVIDAVGCTTSATALITEPSALAITATVLSNLSCFNMDDGSARVEVAGGTAPYTYLWDNAETGQQANLLSAGKHEVTATDANACEVVIMVTLDAPAELLATATITNQIACGEDGNGSASVDASGGTEGYTFLWSNGRTTTSTENLSIGEHCVTVTDANNCVTVSCVTLQGSDELTLTPTVTQVIACNGSNSGAANVAVVGGIAPYTYLWENGDTEAETTNLSAGSYTVTVTDSNDCTAAMTVTLDEPTALNLSLNIDENISCAGDATGQISLDISGGTAPYIFQWNDNQTTSTITNLVAGEYCVTIADANNCMTTECMTLIEPTALMTQIVVTQELLCFGDENGAATAIVVGGTAPYTFAWSGGSDGMNLSAGVHQVSVTDNNGCEQITELILTQPEELTVTIDEITHITATGTNDGAINISVTGGTGNYTFDWDNEIEDVQNPTGLTPATYTVIVTDENACSTTATAIVADPTILTVTNLMTSNATCNGGMDGSINITVFGGTMPYIYEWSNGIGNVQNPTNLGAGTYQVIIIDAMGMTAEASAEITQPTAIEITSLEVSDIACDGSGDGRITVAVTGGEAPYLYDFGNGFQESPIFEGLTSGEYQITIADAIGCMITSEAFMVVLETNLMIQTSVTAPSCAGESDGMIVVNVVGGTPPYSYEWSGGLPTELPAGDYSFTVTDANGCSTEATATIPATPALTASTTSTPDDGTGNGTASVMAEGGTPPYSYNWVDADMQETETISNVAAGTYVVVATDANGCTYDTTVVVDLMSTNIEIESIEHLEIFPNPTADNLTIRLALTSTQATQIRLFDALGRVVLDLPAAQIKTQDYRLDLSDLTSGIYFVRIAVDGQFLGRKIVIE